MAGAQSIKQDIWNLPNILTLGRIVAIPIVCWLVWNGEPVQCLLAAALFGLAAFTDWLDGYIARKRNLISMTGKFLDPLADKLLVMALLVTMIPLGRIPAWFVMLVLAREMSITGLRAVAAGEGLIIAAGQGGKWKTAFQLVGIVCLIVHYQYTLDYFLFEIDVRFHRVGIVLLAVSLAFSLGSGFGYFKGFLEAIDKPDMPPNESA